MDKVNLYNFINYCYISSISCSCYITIVDGIVRIYDTEEICQSNPLSYAFQVVLGSKHQASQAKRKNYSTDPLKVLELYCFYIEIDNGIFASTRLVKIGSPDPALIERLIKCIDYHVG